MANEYPAFLKSYRDALVRKEVAERDEEIQRKSLARTMIGGHNEAINPSTLAKECPDDGAKPDPGPRR